MEEVNPPVTASQDCVRQPCYSKRGETIQGPPTIFRRVLTMNDGLVASGRPKSESPQAARARRVSIRTRRCSASQGRFIRELDVGCALVTQAVEQPRPGVGPVTIDAAGRTAKGRGRLVYRQPSVEPQPHDCGGLRGDFAQRADGIV